MKTTINGLLCNAVSIEQPKEGYRVAVDTVLLAAFVKERFLGERFLDLGCGVGGVMLCLAKRIQNADCTGIEILGELVEICKKNIERNSFASGLKVIQGDISNISIDKADTVIMNPPYYEEKSHTVSKNKIKKSANVGEVSLWIKAAERILKEDTGVLYMIYPYDKLEEVVAVFSKTTFNNLEIKPVFTRRHIPPKRMLLKAEKCSKDGDFIVSKTEPLVLHEENGEYTSIARDILWNGNGM
ncbi:MAG: methyltransferase [Alphaproteobacteria bacterium]|nr:methyltransferase [Alphaproteobacteria bacterium]MCL2505183.1 methyltransferase [Alphaproteobacteria bacterium]